MLHSILNDSFLFYTNCTLEGSGGQRKRNEMQGKVQTFIEKIHVDYIMDYINVN